MRNNDGGFRVIQLTIALTALAGVIAFMPDVSRVLAQQAQQPGTWISELDCSGSPELIVIQNTAVEPQSLEGWKLESDPPAQESLDLTALAIIWPTQTIMIESGPQAEAAFTWSRKQVLRDNDATDYVRIIDNAGTARQEVACASPVVVTPTPTATVLAAAATPSVGSVVPDGGGRPDTGSLSLVSSTAAIAAGGGTVISGLLLFAASVILGRPRTRGAAVEEGIATAPLYVPEPTIEPKITIEPEPPAVERENNSQRALLIALIIVLVTMALAVLVLQPRENNQR